MISKKDIAKLNSLLYLFALSQSSSKREVAEKMGTSVDTVNKYISDLEAELNTYFLVSNGRGTIITPEGRRILKISDSIIKALHKLGKYEEESTELTGIVRLAMPDAISDYLGPRELFNFNSLYPKIHVESNITNKMPDMSALEADVWAGYDLPDDPNLVVVAHKKVKCRLFMSEKYQDLYGSPKNMSDMINNHRLCCSWNQFRHIPEWKEVIDQAQHVVYKTNSIFSLRAAISSGMAIGICPVTRGTQELLPVKKVPLSYDLGLNVIAHKDTMEIPRIRTMVAFIQGLLKTK